MKNNLPPELDLGNLLNRGWPDDMTILDMREWLTRSGGIGHRLVKTAKVSFNKLEVDILRDDGRVWPDEMTLKEVQSLVPPDSLHISFRDGGVKSSIKPRELV